MIAAPRQGSKNAKPIPMSIELHLLNLEQVTAKQEGVALRRSVDTSDLGG
jgi:hypothetical protein